MASEKAPASGILAYAFSNVLQGINTSGGMLLLDSHGTSQVPESSSVKVTLKVLTDNLQIVMCGKFVHKAFEPLFADDMLVVATYFTYHCWHA